MNKEELEKTINHFYNCWFNDYELKDFIFETIIPEVLKSMLVYEWHWINPIIEKRKYANKLIKQKAKELYNINL